MRDARAIMHVCIVNQQWRSRHSRRMHNPQFYVSGKRLMASPSHQQTWHWLHGCGTFMSFVTTITSSTYYWYTVFFLHYDYVHTGLTWQRIGPTLIHLAVSAVIIIHLTANNNKFGYFVNGIMTRYLNIVMICTGYITQWLRIPLLAFVARKHDSYWPLFSGSNAIINGKLNVHLDKIYASNTHIKMNHWHARLSQRSYFCIRHVSS